MFLLFKRQFRELRREACEEATGRLEGTVCHLVPEVQVLFQMLVATRRVAQDAETDEGCLEQVACMGNRCTFHIHSQRFGESCFDLVGSCWVHNVYVSDR